MKKLFAFTLLLTTLSSQAETQPVPPLDQNENELAYFVSFSIPEPQLVALIKNAEQHNIPIYIRGLVKNDMKSTAKAMLYIAGKYNVQGVLIDPVRFDYYGIDTVPALVKKCGDKFDVVFGNVNIEQALSTIRAKGDCK